MERVAKHIADIEKWSKELEGIGVSKIDALDDTKNFHAVSMILFSIFNAVIAIGEEAISIRKLGFPGSYREIFEILEKDKIIDKRLLKKMSQIVRYRNLFAHEYWSYSKKDVWEAMGCVKDVKLFLKSIRSHLA